MALNPINASPLLACHFLASQLPASPVPRCRLAAPVQRLQRALASGWNRHIALLPHSQLWCRATCSVYHHQVLASASKNGHAWHAAWKCNMAHAHEARMRQLR